MAVLATDDFNRADNADVGANWTVSTSFTRWGIVTNAAAPSDLASDCAERYSGATWPDDQYSSAVIKAVTGAGAGVDRGGGVSVRNSTSAQTVYLGICQVSSSNPDCAILKIVTGTFTQLGSANGDFVATDTIYLEVQGTTLKLRKGSGGADLISVTDGAIASGQAGVGYSSTITDFDLESWEGGDFAAAGTAAVTGTAGDGATEAEIVTGGATIITTLTGDTWVTAGATFNAQRQAIINGLDSAGSETNGWNNEVRDKQGVANVVRTSNTVVTITLDAQAAYDITANETITVTVPGSALTSGLPITATPTFDVAFAATYEQVSFRFRNDDGDLYAP